MYDNIT